jgi:hypothetical protein
VEGSSVLVPGFIGNVLVGAVAALISWCLYGPFADWSLMRSADPEGEGSASKVRLPLAALAGAILVGFSGGRWITAESDRRLNHGTAVLAAQAAERASAANPIPPEGTATGAGQAEGVSNKLSQTLLTKSALQAYQAAQQISSAAPGGAGH